MAEAGLCDREGCHPGDRLDVIYVTYSALTCSRWLRRALRRPKNRTGGLLARRFDDTDNATSAVQQRIEGL